VVSAPAAPTTEKFDLYASNVLALTLRPSTVPGSRQRSQPQFHQEVDHEAKHERMCARRGSDALQTSGLALAAPTQAEFDACNREAQLAAQNPAASPGASTRTPGSTASGVSGSTAMAISHEDVISTLDELVATCRDGGEGFRTAAEAARNPELRGLFLTYAQQRNDFRAELEEEIRRLGGDPSTRGSITGSLHRGWMSVRSAVGGGSDDGVVAEAERGEDSARSSYETALRQELPPAIRTIVERQYGRIREAHDRVRSLRERAA